jgi:hypothetical protein
MASMDRSSDPEREDDDTTVVDQTGRTVSSDQESPRTSHGRAHTQAEGGEASASNQRFPHIPPPSCPTPPRGIINSRESEPQQALPHVGHTGTGDLHRQCGLENFITHYHEELQNGRIRSGWQNDVRPEERAQFGLQHYNLYRLLEPAVSESGALSASTSFERQIFMTAKSKDQYVDIAQQKLLKLVEKLRQIAEQGSSSQNGLGPSRAPHASQDSPENTLEESSRTAQQRSSALACSYTGLPIPEETHLADQDPPEYTAQQNGQGPVRARTAVQHHRMRKASRGPGSCFGENAWYWVADRLEYRRICRREQQLTQRNNNQSDLEAQQEFQENRNPSRGCWACFFRILKERRKRFAECTRPDSDPMPAGGVYQANPTVRVAPGNETTVGLPRARPELTAEGRAAAEAERNAERARNRWCRQLFRQSRETAQDATHLPAQPLLERPRDRWYRRLFHCSRRSTQQNTDLEAQPTSPTTSRIPSNNQDPEQVATQPISQISSQIPLSTQNQEMDEPTTRKSFHIPRPPQNQDPVETQPVLGISSQASPSTQVQNPATPESVWHAPSPVAATAQNEDLEASSPPRQVSLPQPGLGCVRRCEVLCIISTHIHAPDLTASVLVVTDQFELKRRL